MEFLVNLKRGNNHQLFNKAREYFKTKGVSVIRYYFSDDNPSRLVGINEANKKFDNLGCCEICGMDLYRVDDSSRYSRMDDAQFIRVVMKKHLVFTTAGGGDIKTCYGINRCYERVGFSPTSTEEVVSLDSFRPPTLEEFIDGDIDLSKIEDYKIKAVEEDYKSYLSPFISKWFPKNIDKSNVLEFINDLNTINSKFIKLYCNPISTFRKKVFKIIGVNYEK